MKFSRSRQAVEPSELDGVVNAPYLADVDSRRTGIRVLVESSVQRPEPGAGAPPDAARQRARAGEDRNHDRAGVGVLELEVVDLAGHTAVAIHELAIHEVESGEDPVGDLGAHAPAFVAIIRGIVATATIVSNTM